MDKNTPKYMELVHWIREQLAEKKLQPGEKLYSENELSAMFQLSRQTVRHAISVLEHEGLLHRVQGSGTYVNNNRLATLADKTRVAVITTYVDGYIFPRTIQGIENTLFEEGYSVQIAFTNNLVERERTILEDIIERDEVAGIIVESTKSGLPNPNLGLYRKLAQANVPIMFINSFYPKLNCPHVSMNDRQAGKKATEYLIGLGHKNIGGIFKLDDGQGHLRYAGYLDAMKKAGLAVEDSHLVWLDTEDIKRLEKSMDKIVDRLSGCSAVVCYNDEVAFGFINHLKQRRIQVPEQLSLVSIDDSELAVLGDVEISSVPHPMEKLGEKAARNLIELMKNPRYEATYEFDVELIVRNSAIPFS